MRTIAIAAALAALGGASAAAQDAAKGKTTFETRCIACHSLEANRVGPALGTVFGRRAGTNPGFGYSPALKAAGHTWDAEKLQKWLTNPQAFVPGATMPFRLGDEQERKNVVAFLQSLKR
ncbi:MAG TPA: c-type cytochrome [Alphaproteobacteria bacterium]|jgi:cytochrome c